MNMTVGWPVEQLKRRVAPALPGFQFEVLHSIDSTNSELMRRARDGWTQPVLLVAEHQTAGRGRRGRHWFSAAQVGASVSTIACLTFSLGLPLMPPSWSGLSLAVGLSIVQSLHPALRLKWPNDVWLGQRKLAGILIETASLGSARYLVVGVGLNIERPQNAELGTAVACLRELLPDTHAGQVVLRLATPMLQTLKAFEQHGFAPFQADFNERDALAGLELTLSDGTTGTGQGVDGDGALRVQTAQGLKRVTHDEVSVQRVCAATS